MSIELLDAFAQEILTLKEKIAFLESREVCAAAHENVETCGYCQRDALLRELNMWADNCDCDCDACRDLSNDIPRSQSAARPDGG